MGIGICEVLKRTVPFSDLRESTTYSANIALDAGSTGTRSLTYELRTDTNSQLLVLGAEYLKVTSDISGIESPTPAIEDNLELIIKTANPSNMLNKQHIIKGDLRSVLSDTSTLVSGTTSKTLQDITYINIIANMAILLLCDSIDKQLKVRDYVPVDLAVSLPSEDIDNKVLVTDFKTALSDKYDVEFPRLGVTVKFELVQNSIHCYSEPEASAAHYYWDHDFDRNDIIVFIEGGGRSIGSAIIRNGRVVRGKTVPVNGGGSQMLEVLAKEIARKYKIDRPSPSDVAGCLDTGKQRLGGKYVDVGDCIDTAKEEILPQLQDALTRVLDLNTLKITNIAKIVFSGRLFGKSVDKGTVVSQSMVDILKEQMSSAARFTDFEKIGTEYPIPCGLSILRMMELGN